MSDPLADRLAALAPSVDEAGARAAFDARRRGARTHRRALASAAVGAVVVVAAAGLAWGLDDRSSNGVVTSGASTVAAPAPTVAATAPATPPSSAAPTKPGATVLAVAGCPVIDASQLATTRPMNLFARTAPDGTPVQAIATAAGIEGPYVVALRFFGDTRAPVFGDPVDVNGRDARVYVGPQGQGSISWMLADGSEAYLRARGLSSDELVTVARALTPRPATVAAPGFDVTAAVPGGMQLVAETATPLSLRSAVATCDRADVADLRVGVFEGDPAALYAFGLDESPLPVLRQHGALVAWARSNNTDVAAAALDEATASPPPESTPSTSPPATIPTVPTVTFTATRPAAGQPNCSLDACRFVDVTLLGFPPGAEVAVSCHSDVTGSFGASPVTIGPDGTATQEACYFGYAGAALWVEADGVTSPTVVWPPD